MTEPRGRTIEFTYDHRGNVLTLTDANGEVTTRTYDLNGRLQTETDPLERTTTCYHDAAGRVVGTLGPDPDGAGPLQPVTTATTYDGDGRVLTQTDAGGRTVEKVYDARGLILAEIGVATAVIADDEEKLLRPVTRFRHDERGLLTRKWLPNPEAVDQLAAPYVDAAAPDEQYEYDSLGRMTRMVGADPDPAVGDDHAIALYEHDGFGNVVRETGPLEQVTEMVYDKADRLLSRTLDDMDGGGPMLQAVTASTYDAAGSLLSETDAGGFETKHAYAPSGLKLWTELPEALIDDERDATPASYRLRTTTEYDLLGRPTAEYLSAVTPAGEGDTWHRTDIAYALDGREVTRTHADPDPDPGQEGVDVGDPRLQTVSTYDAVGNLESVVERTLGGPAFLETRTFYDDLNRPYLTRVVPEGGGDPIETSRAYDADGNVASETDALGRVTLFEYTAAGLLVKTTPPSATAYGASQSSLAPLVATAAYDVAGRKVRETDARGGPTRHEHDLVGRVTETTYPDADPADAEPPGFATRSYDAAGNVVRTQSVLGRIVNSTFNERGQLALQTDRTPADSTAAVSGATRTTTYLYDARGHVESTDVEGRLAEFQTDALGRVSQATLPATDAGRAVTTRTFDEHGNERVVTDANGGVTETNYDEMGRVSYYSGPLVDGGRPRVRTEYDAEGCVSAEVTAVRGLSGPDLWTRTFHDYDGFGRRDKSLVWNAETPGAYVATLETEWTHDKLGRVLTTTVEDRTGEADFPVRTASTTYDELGRVVREFTADPDGAGPLPAMETRTEYGADGDVAAFRVYAGTPLVSEMLYDHDGLGRVTLQSRTDLEGGPSADAATAYGLAGNVVRTTDAEGFSTQMAYDGRNQFLTTTDALGDDTEHAYDAFGNRLTTTDALGRVTASTYDALDRVLITTRPDPDGGPTDGNQAPSQAFTYDLLGNVVRVEDHLGRQWFTQYELLNRPTRQVSPHASDTASYPTLAALDAAVDAADDPAAAAWPDTYTVYDFAGNTVKTRDELGYVSEATYDALSRLLVATRPYKGAQPLADPDQLSTVTAAGDQTSYTSDGFGNQLTSTTPTARPPPAGTTPSTASSARPNPTLSTGPATTPTPRRPRSRSPSTARPATSPPAAC